MSSSLLAVTTNYLQQQFSLEICGSKGIPGVLSSSTMCSNLSPLGFPCSQRGGTPNTSHPPPAQAHTQQTSRSFQAAWAGEGPEIPPVGTEVNKHPLKSAQHLNSSLPELSIPVAGC